MAEDEKGEKEMMMPPWEQHSSIINLPRFDYHAPSSILNQSHSGFLITCTIKREKSATKEAISILEKYVCSSTTRSVFSSPDKNSSSKRRKICDSDEEAQSELITPAQREVAEESAETIGRLTAVNESVSSGSGEGFPLSLVKLIRSGLLLFVSPCETSLGTVDILSKILSKMDSGNQKRPVWCHRILPFQATCCLKEKELEAVVSKLVHQYIMNKQHKIDTPLKFGVGYNRRGFGEAELKQKPSQEDSCPLDRNQCLRVAAGAVKSVLSDAVVDLKFPQMVVLIEALPLAGVPADPIVVAVSVLPFDLVNTKPKLAVKSLATDQKSNNGKS